MSGVAHRKCFCSCDVVCCRGGVCCFSDSTRIRLTWSLTNVTSTFGNQALLAGYMSGDLTSPPSCQFWSIPQAVPPASAITIERIQFFNGTELKQQWQASAYEFGPPPPYAASFNAVGGIAVGDCCGGTETVQDFGVHHVRASDGQVIALASGTGTLSFTVLDNRCCQDIPTATCYVLSGDCTGQCVEDLP